MSEWRVIETDSENVTGVGPVCPHQAEPNGEHDREGLDKDDETARYDNTGVYDCCPGPHLECYSTAGARELAEVLSRWEVTVCD